MEVRGQARGTDLSDTQISRFKQSSQELLEIRGDDSNFIDFHTGSTVVAGDGTIYFSNSNRIWRLGGDRRMALVAGTAEKGFLDGIGKAARFDSPCGMCVEATGDLLVAEQAGRIRRVSRKGEVTTAAGGKSRGYKDGALKEARFALAFGVGIGPKRRTYFAEYEEKREYRIRVIAGGKVTTLARVPSDGVFVK